MRSARIPTGQRRSTVEEQVTLDGWGKTPSEARLLLDGVPGREGFLFHDSHRPVHQAAPGLLGLIEARPVMHRWKPAIVRWLDGTEHFFNHLFAEFRSQPYFEGIGAELQAIAQLSAPWEARNGFLFTYLTAISRELERRELTRSAARRHALPIASGRAPQSVSLNGTWTAHYRQTEGVYVDREMTLPVNWELVSDISNYAGSMRFTKVLRLDRSVRAPSVGLRFHGVDYFADVWVNGHHVGGHEGYFAPFDMDISRCVRYGDENIIRLAVTSPNEPTCDGTHVNSGWDSFSPDTFPNRKTMVKGTLGHHDAKRGGAWNCLTSQDGNTGGVWNDTELRLCNSVHFAVLGTRVTTGSMSPPTPDGECDAAVRITLPIHNDSDLPVDARVSIDIEPANFKGTSFQLAMEVKLSPGVNQVTFAEDLRIRPWHARDHGFPHLYTVASAIEVGGAVKDRSCVETGFRTLAVSPIGESQGPDGAFLVNGKRVVVRGTNLLPTYWLSEYSVERVSRDFEMLCQSGFNGLLLHNLVAPKAFYEQANRNGFLVVQMFPLQWSYDQSPEFVARASEQIKDMAALLCNEPSVVSYEVHNEPDLRMNPEVDNRFMDVQLHAVLREADPSRWATTFSGGNHAYPGQFYPLRDDNAFQTLPARFQVDEFDGRRISRHRNMPTEFGLQAMPHVELFAELMSESRVKSVLRRIRTDPQWLAAGGDSWREAEHTVEMAKRALGGGSWRGALQALDWARLWDLGRLTQQLKEIEDKREPGRATGVEKERLALKLALLLLDVLHYSGFKGQNFWFGLWRPAHTLEEFVESSHDRQYRMHKDAIEMYLNASVAGPITGYFGFMFRDADWQAPTWGVVDASWVPKKAYRAYCESNQPVRVTLPGALVGSVRLPGDRWVSAPAEERGVPAPPWVAAEMIVANDTDTPLPGASVRIWLEDDRGTAIPLRDGFGARHDAYRLTLDLPARGGWTAIDGLPLQAGTSPAQWLVADDTPSGRYYVRAEVSSAAGDSRSTNSYELYVPDTEFGELDGASRSALASLLDGASGRQGFHFWQGAHLLHRAGPGVRGLLDGLREAEVRGGDLYEVVQGEHLFRHLLDELRDLEPARRLRDEIWRIRSELISPAEKARVLLRYLELFRRRAEDRIEGSLVRTDRSHRTSGRAAIHSRRASRSGSGGVGGRSIRPMKAVGRDRVTPREHRDAS